MKRRIPTALTLAACLFLLTFLAGPQYASPSDQNTFLWRVRSSTATIYILGSLHFFKKEFYPLNKKIDEVFDQSQVLVVEANIHEPGELNPSRLKETAFYPANDRLDKHISSDTYGLVRTEADRLGIPLEAINRQRPWFLAMTLEAMELLKLGFDPRYGIDMNFLLKAEGKKKILELEGVDNQFNLLSGLSEKEQELFLWYTIKDLSAMSQEIDQYARAWISGDVKAMEILITKNMPEEVKRSSIPEKLYYERNRKMARRIEDLLRTRETYFVIVGAGHLVGSQGIIELLSAKGYAVEQR